MCSNFNDNLAPINFYELESAFLNCLNVYYSANCCLFIIRRFNMLITTEICLKVTKSNHTTLFRVAGEKIYSNLTRLVIIVWLCVVLILSSSYTANLSSMLTVQKLQPNVTDIEWLKMNNLKIGCDGDSFVRTYLENVIKFKPENIVNVSSQDLYPGEFKSNNISAAFLELPYEKVFINKYCKDYTATIRTNRFGGLGFVSIYSNIMNFMRLLF